VVFIYLVPCAINCRLFCNGPSGFQLRVVFNLCLHLGSVGNGGGKVFYTYVLSRPPAKVCTSSSVCVG